MLWSYKGPTSQCSGKTREYHLSARPGPALALYEFLTALQPPILVAHPLWVETEPVTDNVIKGVGYVNPVRRCFKRLKLKRRGGQGVRLDFYELGDTLELSLSQGGVCEVKAALCHLAEGLGDFSIFDDGEQVALTFWVPGRH